MKLLMLLGMAVLVLVFLEKGYGWFWHRGLQVRAEFQPHPAIEGEEAFLTETIENRKVFPVPALQVEILIDNELGLGTEENASKSDKQYQRDIFSVSACQKISRKLKFTCKNRGYYEIRKVSLTAKSLLMTGNHFKEEEQNTYLYVYPGKIPLSGLHFPLKHLGGMLERRKGLIEDPFAFAGLREYDGTDPMNKINWKASARTGNLMVNVQNSTYSPALTCFLDVEDATLWEHREIHEEGIRLAASLLGILLKRGVPAALFSNGLDCGNRREVQLFMGSGCGQAEKLNRALSRLDLSEKKKKRPLKDLLQEHEKELSDHRQVILIITESREQSLFDLAGRLGKNGASVLWIETLTKETEWRHPRLPNVDFVRWEIKRK